MATRRRAERSAAVVGGCKAPPVLLSGKERLDCVTLAIQPLAVMGWFLAAATRRGARRDALLGQHLTDFVTTIPLIPHHRCRRRQSLRNTSAPVKSLHCPSRRWSHRGSPLLSQIPWSLLVMPPLVPPIRRGASPPRFRRAPRKLHPSSHGKVRWSRVGTHHQKRPMAARRRAERSAAVVAGCKAPPVLLSGKERLDCVTLAIQPLAVMDWFLAAATGWDARPDALLGQHFSATHQHR